LKKQVNQYREDINLVRAVRSGDQLAFRDIVEKYRQTVATTVIGMLGNKADADDIGQEVFIRFYHSIDQYKGEASLATYLTRIGINLSLNEIKKRKRKSWTSFEDNPSFDQTSEDEYSSNEYKEIVHKGLTTLEPEFRSVLVLRLIQGYSTKEVAKILEIPLGTVLSRLARAQDKLKNAVEKMGVSVKE
jgi:RNA polymerase sigma-70 factor (ECF subfamily)